jgi:ribulose-5-phosphate 4-epimerase/fuculose-1-phosphate aldolase
VTQQEGIIRFQLVFSTGVPLPYDSLRQINAWRKVLYLAQLIGQFPDRYWGFGYGNISQRVSPFDAPPFQRRFVISGTQTGGLADLTEAHYTTVLEFDPDQNLVVAEGPIRPSSESLTHGMVYALGDTVRSVIHVHSPDIWRSARALGLPITDEKVTYGTPEMAREVERLFEATPVGEQCIFAMGGHEDGVVGFGGSVEEAGVVLVRYLARALQLATPGTADE